MTNTLPATDIQNEIRKQLKIITNGCVYNSASGELILRFLTIAQYNNALIRLSNYIIDNAERFIVLDYNKLAAKLGLTTIAVEA